ncbi:LysR family transcriptional regulator [Azospirillum rugosum]|uniref:DNA-binding transcriptional LysR family regulator n=1 Tax=Azospirillum rugosum TaxID=416170 RepID=A0ABS4SQQ5_9PROT|nr:LysR family transcriptional regulator [Azospirillum rugosum]MBP2294902.1 DNA-binding transcriptional LysR family regulator [Azospirillum rugosum]MDQ0528176.1 DNA-binding transcriptional LysR family regulator [Azospirillum rugosum]
MKLNEIRTFVAVAEAQSVQEAGNRLGLTQSAVSRLIQRLEAELGVALFDRQTKPLVLTRDGEQALAHARRVLQATDDLSDAFAAVTRPRGLLRLGVAHVLTTLTAHQPLDTLRAAFPDLTVRLHSDWSTPLMEQVRNGTLDGAVVLLYEGQVPPEDLAATCVGREPVSIIAPPGRRDPTIHDMNALGWVLQPDGCRYRTSLTELLARHGLPLNIAVEAFDQSLLVSLVARGVGYGLAPLRLIAPVTRATPISTVNVPDFDLTVAVWLVRARFTGRIGPVFDALEDSLRAELPSRFPSPSLPVLHSAAE